MLRGYESWWIYKVTLERLSLINMSRVYLDYSIDVSRMASVNFLSSASVEELHFDYFLGNVSFIVDGADFSADWGWVPVLDFAISLHRIIRDLHDDRPAVFEFTESDATIKFILSGGRIIISSSYSNTLASVDHAVFSEKTHLFAQKVISDLAAALPVLRQNPHFVLMEEEFRT